MTIRKQSYVIWFDGIDGSLPDDITQQTRKKPQPPVQETTATSPTKKPVDYFSGLRKQSSEIEHLSEEDKALMAKLYAQDKKEEAYHNSPRGIYMETPPYLETEDWMDRFPEEVAWCQKESKEQITKYNALDVQGKVIADLDDWISRQGNRRRSEYNNSM